MVYTGADDAMGGVIGCISITDGVDGGNSPHKGAGEEVSSVHDYTNLNSHEYEESNSTMTSEDLSEMQGSVEIHLPDGEMKYELNRLLTFWNYPSMAPVKPLLLARAGLCYTGSALATKCFTCGIIIEDWLQGDDPNNKHLFKNSDCDFVNLRMENITIEENLQNMEPGTRIIAKDYEKRTEAVATSTQVTLKGGSPFQSSTWPLHESSVLESDHAAPSTSEGRFNSLYREPSKPSPSNGYSHAKVVLARLIQKYKNLGVRNLKSESDRLKTFHDWPLIYIRPRDLAKSGFFFLLDRDRVQCVFCRVIIGEWEEGDEPEVEHRQHSVRCPFIRQLPVGNVPIISALTRRNDYCGNMPVEPTSRSPAFASNHRDHDYGHRGYDVCGTFTIEQLHGPQQGVRQTGSSSRVTLRGGSPQDLERLGIQKYGEPHHPEYATEEARMRSFDSWPKSMPQRPKQLADAGLFYIGVSDHVKCFDCSGGLKDWEPEDDPWIEHTRWYPKCRYVNLVKGKEFIDDVHHRFPPNVPNHINWEAPNSLTSSGPQSPVDEEQVEQILHGEMGLRALDMGLDQGLVKQAIRHRLENAGLPFPRVENLIEETLHLQEQHRYVAEMEQNRSPSPQESELSLYDEETRLSGEDEAGMLAAATAGTSPGSGVSQETGYHSAEEATDTKDKDETSKSSPKKSKREPSEDEKTTPSESNLCKVCLDAEVGIVFLPCGHLVACPKCSVALSSCPICRTRIQGTVRTFLS